MKEIKLLDGTDWAVSDLIEKMYDNEFYYGYLNKACLSSSSCKKLLEGIESYLGSTEPLDANSKPLRDGRLIHVSLLEQDKLDDYYHFVDASTRRNKAYKEAIASDEFQGKEIMLLKEKVWAKGIIDAVLDNPTANELFKDADFEKPGIGYIQGLPFRGKADCLRDDRIVDLKTTSDIDNWDYNMYYYGYDAQAYIYTRIFNKKSFTFVIVDKKTLQVKTYDATENDIESGKEKVSEAIGCYIANLGF
jgi:hypothetical protein